jgi:signal peptidase I
MWGADSSPGRFRRFLQALWEIFQTAFIALLLFLVVNLITTRIRVEGISMEPNLHDGQFVLVNKLAYRWKYPQRGDVIVFYYPLDPSRRFIKRLIGLPGDVVTIRAGEVYVNGEQMIEPYASSPTTQEDTWRIGPSETFVMGDNRDDSSDSRRWGPLPLNEIIGKALFAYWPPDEIGTVEHYHWVNASSDGG